MKKIIISLISLNLIILVMVFTANPIVVKADVEEQDVNGSNIVAIGMEVELTRLAFRLVTEIAAHVAKLPESVVVQPTSYCKNKDQ
jgi:hypothetical protein